MNYHIAVAFYFFPRGIYYIAKLQSWARMVGAKRFLFFLFFLFLKFSKVSTLGKITAEVPDRK